MSEFLKKRRKSTLPVNHQNLGGASFGGGGGDPLLAQIQAMFGGGESGIIYDYTNPVTLFQERTGAAATTPSGNNGPIGTLKDLSPNNNYAIAPGDAARPLSRQGAGAPNVYGDYDGIDDRLICSFSITQPFTRVSCWLSVTNNGLRLFGSNNGGGVLLNDNVDRFDIYSGSSFAGVSQVAGVAVVTSEIFDGASSKIALNNAAYITGNAGSGNPSNLVIAADNDAGSFPATARYFRVVEIAGVRTDPEITLCRTWCGAAAGLAL